MSVEESEEPIPKLGKSETATGRNSVLNDYTGVRTEPASENAQHVVSSRLATIMVASTMTWGGLRSTSLISAATSSRGSG